MVLLVNNETETGPDQTILTVSPTMWAESPIAFSVGIVAIGLSVLLSVVLLNVVPLGFAIVVGLIGLGGWISRKNTVLTVEPEKTILTKGVLGRSSTELWHRDIRTIEVKQALDQRFIGAGTICIATAGHAGWEIVVTGLEHPNRVRDTINQLLGRSSPTAVAGRN